MSMEYKEKTMYCPGCGSDNLVWEGWVDEHNMYVRDRAFEYAPAGKTIIRHCYCEKCNEEVTPRLKEWNKYRGT